MKGIKYSFIGLLFAFFMSCKKDLSQEVYSRSDYISWVQSSEMFWQKQVGGIVTNLEYIPSDYKMLMDFRSSPKAINDSIQLRYSHFDYYKLSVSHADGESSLVNFGATNTQDYVGRLEFLLSDIQPDFYIVESSDTIHCIDSYFERSYGMQKGLILLLTFPKSSKSSGKQTFIYEERLFNLGKLQFTQSLEVLNNQPTLKM